MLGSTLLCAVVVGFAPAQGGPAAAPPSSAAAPPPAAGPPAAAPVASGKALRLAAPADVAFFVDTNVGRVQGTIHIAELVARGLDGKGRFELTLALDPSSLKTGDRLRDRLLAEQMLAAGKGPLRVTSVVRLPPALVEGPEPRELPAALAALDERRRGKALELRYAFEASPDGGTLVVEHKATLDELGLGPPPHPFVEVQGPLHLSLKATLLRER